MSSTKLSVLISGVDQLTKPLANTTRSITQFGNKFSGLSDEAAKLASRHDRLERQLGESASALDIQRRKASELGKTYKGTASPTRAQTQAHHRQQKAVKKAAEAHAKLKREIVAVRGEIRAEGHDLTKLSAAASKASQSIQKTGKSHKSAFGLGGDNYAKAANLSFVTAFADGAARRVQSGLVQPINQLREVERARGELQSLGIEDTDTIVNQGLAVSKTVAGVTASMFTSAAYDIKSGISTLSTQGVADMTKAAAFTAKATKADLGQMTSLFATAYGTFKETLPGLSDSEFGNQFGAALSASVQAFKTDGGAMQQALQSAGSQGSLLGVSMAEQMTVLGMLQQKMEAGSAGTAYKSFIAKIGQSQDKFATAGLDIQTTNEDGKLLSITEIMAQLKDQLGDDFTDQTGQLLMKALGSEEAAKVVQGLWDQTGSLAGNIKTISENSAKGAAFTKAMSDVASDNFDDRLTLMGQKWNALLYKIGVSMMPALDLGIRGLEWLTQKFDAMFTRFPKFTGFLSSGAVLFAGLAATVTPVVLAFKTLASVLSITKQSANSAAARLRSTSGVGSGGGSVWGARNTKWAKFGGVASAAIGAISLASTLSDDSLSKNEKVEASGGTVGGMAGAAAGAAIGSVVPIFGTIVGGALGYYLGSEGGSLLAKRFTSSDGDSIKKEAAQAKVQQQQRASQHMQQNNQTTINIQQQPGENVEEFGERVRQIVDQENARHAREHGRLARGAMFDMEMVGA